MTCGTVEVTVTHYKRQLLPYRELPVTRDAVIDFWFTVPHIIAPLHIARIASGTESPLDQLVSVAPASGNEKFASRVTGKSETSSAHHTSQMVNIRSGEYSSSHRPMGCSLQELCE